MGRREQNREERRAKALHAARILIAEGGVEALSMRQLSMVAGLAVNTVYALFGSRDGVLSALITDAIDESAVDVTLRPSGDALDVAMALAKKSVTLRVAAADITRPLFKALATQGATKQEGMERAGPLLRSILGRAVEDGLLRDDVDLDVLGRHLLEHLVHTSMRWAFEEIDAETYEASATYAVVLAFAAASTPAGRERTEAALRAAERRLRAPGRR